MFRALLISAAAASLFSCTPGTEEPVKDTGRAAWSKVDERAQQSLGSDERDAVRTTENGSGWQF
jgi:hypothetical protein